MGKITLSKMAAVEKGVTADTYRLHTREGADPGLVEGVGDHEQPLPPLLTTALADVDEVLQGVTGTVLQENRLRRHTRCLEMLPPRLRLATRRPAGEAAGDDDAGRFPSSPEVRPVVQPGSEDPARAIVLQGTSQDEDRVRGPALLAACLLQDLSQPVEDRQTGPRRGDGGSDQEGRQSAGSQVVGPGVGNVSRHGW